MPDRISAIVALVIDVQKEAEALGVARGFIARTGLKAAGLGWSAYTKNGPHSRVSFGLKLPPVSNPQDIVQAIEAICAFVVTPEAAKLSYLNSFFNGDGSLFYNRIFDARANAFTIPGILWLDIEVNTNADSQADLARLLAQA
ncbi:MAG: hypothetical protein WDM79_09030 [Terricaulis sp.]